MSNDPLLYAVAAIAEADGVSVSEVFERGEQDLAIRLALMELRADAKGGN